MTHSRYGLFLNNTLMDSSFDNIRMFGNGFAAVYFGEGTMENLRFSNITYDKDCKPLKEDEHIYIDWNNTRSDGFGCVLCNGTEFTDVTFDGMRAGRYMTTVFGGHGKGSIRAKEITMYGDTVLSDAEGIEIK